MIAGGNVVEGLAQPPTAWGPDDGPLALAGLCRTVRQAVEGERNTTLHWAGARLAEHVLAGRIRLPDGVSALSDAAREAGLPSVGRPNEVEETISNGLAEEGIGRSARQVVELCARPAPVVVEADAFWDARLELATIRDWARARLVPPWSLFGAVLARTLAMIEPVVVLPPTVGGVTSLTSVPARDHPGRRGPGQARR